MTRTSTVLLALALLCSCDKGESTTTKTAKQDTKAAEAQPAPEPKPEVAPEVEPEPPPAFMAEPERLSPKGEPFADHERREVDVSGLARRGSESAPVTVMQCIDLRDPYCRRGQTSMAAAHEALGDEVAFYLRPYWNVLESTEQAAAKGSADAKEMIEVSKRLARALVAAEAQGKIWELHDALLAAEAEQYTAEGIAALAGEIEGLDAEAFTAQLDAPETEAAADAHHEACAALGVETRVPAYFVNGRMMVGGLPTDALSYVLEVEANGGFEKLPNTQGEQAG